MAHFKVKKITNLDEIKIGDEICDSDYSHYTKTGQFVQFEYIKDDEEKRETIVKPGIWSIESMGPQMVLRRTEFSNDLILNEFLYTEEINRKVNSFFTKLDVYKKFGIEIPRRAALLYGPAGSGKSSGIRKVVQDHSIDGKTAVLIWSTDSHDPYDVKTFIKSFKYEGVEKLIFILEDLGGVEVQNVDVPSDPSLLALLDNSEKIFKIPVYILSTTNFPAIFASNLANRPGRFDDKIKVPYPPPEYRVKLLEFFLKEDQNLISQEIIDLMLSNKTNGFTPAHIRETVVRSALHDKTLLEAANEIIKEIEIFSKAFEEKGKFGFS